MNEFKNIFEQAKTYHVMNKELQLVKDEELLQLIKNQEKDIENKRKNKTKTYNYETECYSQELLLLIKKFNFNIEAYEKFEDFSEEDFEPILEVYYCKVNNWTFNIENCSDVDISEGIFALRNIKNTNTSEVIDFYCDLGCRNTGKIRLSEVLEFFEFDSLDTYIQKKYKKYITLPKTLINAGYKVEQNDYSFNLNNASGYLKLDNNLYIKVYRAWSSDIKLVVTNNNGWDVNSSNSSTFGHSNKAYYFNYEKENCFVELCKCIEAFKDDINGEIGYVQNDKYYNNSDIHKLFHQIKNSNKESWNHYLIQLEHKKHWDCRGYDENNSLIPNKYKGLEIYTETTLTFNEAAQWTIGKYSNKSIIVFEYDKRKDSKNCKLIINNYIYDGDCEVYNYNEDTGTQECTLNETKLVGKVELSGSFSSLYIALESYLNNMLKIHEITLNE